MNRGKIYGLAIGLTFSILSGFGLGAVCGYMYGSLNERKNQRNRIIQTLDRGMQEEGCQEAFVYSPGSTCHRLNVLKREL